jgi:CHAT domain-containing protein
MNEQRQSDYLDLIQQLLGCPRGEEPKLLAANQHLLDAGFLQMCEQVALLLTEQQNPQAAAWLRDLVIQLAEAVNGSSSSSDMSQERLIILLLQAVQETAGDTSVLHPILRKNSSLLTPRIANLLVEVFAQSIRNADNDTRQAMAAIMHSLGHTFRRLPFGSPETNHSIAISAFKNSLEIFTESELPELWAPTINELGICYREIAKYTESPGEYLQMSINAHISAMRIFTKSHNPREWANTNDNLGCAYITFAAFSEDPKHQFRLGINSFNDALRARGRDESTIGLAGTTHNLGCAYKDLAKYSDDPRNELERAVEYFCEALRIYEAENIPEQCANTNNMLGQSLISLTDFSAHPQDEIENSIVALTSALRVLTETNQPNDWASANGLLGTAYCKKFQHSSPSDPNATLYLMGALKAFDNALRLYKRTDQTKEYHRILIDISIPISGLAFLGDASSPAELKDADGMLTSALQEITEQSEPLTWARLNNTLGIILGFIAINSDDPAKETERSLAAFSNSLRVWTECVDPESWSTANKNIGDAHAKLFAYGLNAQENVERSIAAYINSLRYRDPVSRSYQCLQTAQSLGNLGVSSGRLDMAIKGYSIAITAAENLRFRALHPARKEEIISEAIKAYANLVKVHVHLGDYDKALEVVDRSKCRNLVELLSVKDLYPKGEVKPEVIFRLDELRGSIARMERLLKGTGVALGVMDRDFSENGSDVEDEVSQSARLARTKSADEALRQAKIDLEKLIHEDIQPLDPTFTLSQEVQPLTFEKLRESLPDDKTIIVSWYVADDSLFAFILTKHDSHPHCHQYPRPTLELLAEALNSYFNLYQLNQLEWLYSLPTALARLSSLLEIQDIATTISRLAPQADQLILVPHRFLHLVPLHCLPFGSTHSTLLDHFLRGVRFAPSIQVLQLVQQRTKPVLQKLFAVQNPTQDLRYSDLEVACIQHQFSNEAFVLKQQSATKSALRSNATVMANSNCLHFACHGTFNFREPQLSALQLAPSNNPTDHPAPENGLGHSLTLLDLFELDLRHARLVALSACETGLSDLNSLSDEFVGLSSGFLYAGANNVVGSLWTVSDISTSLLMVEFYRRLQEQEKNNHSSDVALALRQAQLWLRDLTREDAVGFLHDMLGRIPEEQRSQYQEDINELENTYDYDECPYKNPFFWAAFCTLGQ